MERSNPTQRERGDQKVSMADNKMGPNLQAGARIFAKRVQKSLNRGQEKVRRYIWGLFNF